LAPEAREGRLRRQVRARALRRARGEGAPRWLPDGGRRAPRRGRAGRDRGLPLGARHERAAQRGGRRGDRSHVGACRALRGGHARRDPGRPPAARSADHARRVLRSRRGADARVSLAFLSPSRCGEGTLTSPLRRALEHADDGAGRDLSLQGVVEVRGDVDSVSPARGEELVRLSPRRGFLFTDDDPAEVAERVRAGGALAYDASGALAGIALRSEQAMRRLTDLDFEKLPAAGPFARVTALVLRDEAGWFRVYVQQELGHYVAEAVLDALAGLEAPGA